MAFGRLSLSLGLSGGGGTSAAFTISLSNLTSGEARNGDVIGVSISPALGGGETVTYQWTDNGTPISGATSSTFTVNIGTNMTDGQTLRCEVTIDGETFTSNGAPARYAPGTFGALSNQSFSDDSGDQTYVFPAATGTGLTWTYALTSPPAGVSIVSATRTITHDTDAMAVQAGTVITVTATDQYGRPAAGSPRTYELTINEVVIPVLDSVTVSDAGSGSGTMTLTFDAGETPGTTVYVRLYIDADADPDPNAATAWAGTGAILTGSVTTTVGATGVSVPLSGAATGSYRVFAVASYENTGNNLSNVVATATTVAFDTEAPGLSLPSGTQTGATTADLSVTSNDNTGTVYGGAWPTASTPDADAVQAGTGATFHDSAPAENPAGANAFSATGLTASTAYKAHFVHVDSNGNRSTVSTSAEFTTASAGPTYADSKVATLFSDAVWGSQTLDGNDWWVEPGASARADTNSSDFAFSSGVNPPSGITLTAVVDVRENTGGNASLRLWNVTSANQQTATYDTRGSSSINDTTKGIIYNIDGSGNVWRLWAKVTTTATGQRIIMDIPTSADTNNDYRLCAIFEGDLSVAEIEGLS